MSCSVTLEAYCKIVLHAAKYPTLTVCGLLMGSVDPNLPEGATVATDAVPVCHTAPVGPLFDITADVVRAQCSHSVVTNRIAPRNNRPEPSSRTACR